MPTHFRMIWSVFRRNFTAYFINPTGYVFITVFILLGAVAAFWQDSFFMNNLANLDQLNEFFPILLLFFVPALTMNVWSEERRQGTDELLFTLPGHDLDIVLGKYFAVLGIYSVAVLFSLSHLIILMWLGKPDLGLMAATYFGYWLAGASLLAMGMVASLLTANGTVAFILGAVFCAAIVFVDQAGTLFGTFASEIITNLGIRPHFEEFGNGLVLFSGLLYFVGLTVVMLYLNVLLVGRRHTKGGAGSQIQITHYALRTIAIAITAMSLFTLVDRIGASVDTTAERLHTLQPQTKMLLDQINPDRPVFIQAYFSSDVPEAFVQTRKNLVNVLNRFDSVAGDSVQVVVHDTEPYSEDAAAASENYNIFSRPVVAQKGSQRSTADIFLGLVFTSGPEEFVIPFFDRGLPVEYELARSIRVVSQVIRKKLGVVSTDAQIFGGFDFQTMTSRPDWSIVHELRKQYEVVQIAPTGPYPEDLDALLVVLPSSLTQPEMDTLQVAILSGIPTLLFDDPLPIFNPNISPSLPKSAGQNPFNQQGQPQPEPKGNIDSMLAALGLSWSKESIVWSGYNPHPAISDVAPEVVFVSSGPDNEQPFNPDSIISSGLQEVVMLFPGFVRAVNSIEGANLLHTPLLTTGNVSGDSPWATLVRRDFFGVNLNPNPRRFQSADSYTLAIHVEGTIPVTDAVVDDNSESENDPSNNINVIFVADVDGISETFFGLRRQGIEDFTFDNVTFALNCIDKLAGDESFVALRKHRSKHRSLSRVEELSQVYLDERRTEADAAESLASDQLVQAQIRLDQKVNEIRSRTDLDDRTKNMLLRNVENVENRKLDVTKANIEQEKNKSITLARAEMERAVAGIQRGIKWWAAVIPPVPTLLLAIFLFAYRFKREKLTAPERRLVEAAS